MSKLSKLFHSLAPEVSAYGTDIVRSIVEHLETVDIPGDKRKEIAMAMLQTLHVGTGQPWDAEIVNQISGAIEYVLAKVRQAAKALYPQLSSAAPTPTATSTT
jgi:hypothetical protein